MDDGWVNLWDWVQTVTPDQLPPVPFALGPQEAVWNAERWLADIQAQAREGAKAPRARYGALQRDLRRIYALTQISGGG